METIMKQEEILEEHVVEELEWVDVDADESDDVDVKPVNKWSDEASIFFLKERLAIEPLFKKRGVKKIALFKMLAGKLNAAGHTGYSAIDCLNKFKTLMATYRRNVERKKLNGDVIWEHFEALNECYGLYKEPTKKDDEPEHQIKEFLHTKKKPKQPTKVVSQSQPTEGSTEEDTLNKTNDDDDSCKWTDMATKLFLTERLRMEPEFRKGTIKKVVLYRRLKEKMQRAGYRDITQIDCINKFKSLLATYRRNVKRIKSGSGVGITWEYFKEMDWVFGKGSNVRMPPEELLNTLADSDNESRCGSTTNTPKTANPSRKRKNPKELLFMMYIQEKMKRDEEQENKLEEFLKQQTLLSTERNRILEQSMAERNEMIQQGIDERNRLLEDQNAMLKRLLDKL